MKIEITYKRIFDVDEKQTGEAEIMAQERACDEFIEACKEEKEAGYSAMRHLFEAKLYEEPRNWHAYAKELAEDAYNNYSLQEAVEKAASEQSGVDEAYEELYQGRAGNTDLYDIAWEVADSQFIYNHRKALIEALECIDELEDYASGDSGLWEGKTEYWDIINIQAYDALNGAIMHYLEEIVREKLEERYNAQK